MKLFFRKSGEGKPLFVLHGLFGLSDNWNTVGKILAEHFKVYLIDLRNHGSTPHSDEWNYDAMANDILELMNDERLEKINLLGHSLGGKVTMQFASMFPEKLERLIVVDMAPKDYPGKQFDFIEKLLAISLSEIKSRKEAEAELRKIIRDEATIQLLLKNITPSPSGSPPYQGGDNRGGYAWKFNLKVIASNQDKIGKTFSIKDKTETPSLFIRGEKSNYILDSDIPAIKKIFPNSEFKTIANAGHWVHADKPEEFVTEVVRFLK